MAHGWASAARPHSCRRRPRRGQPALCAAGKLFALRRRRRNDEVDADGRCRGHRAFQRLCRHRRRRRRQQQPQSEKSDERRPTFRRRFGHGAAPARRQGRAGTTAGPRALITTMNGSSAFHEALTFTGDVGMEPYFQRIDAIVSTDAASVRRILRSDTGKHRGVGSGSADSIRVGTGTWGDEQALSSCCADASYFSATVPRSHRSP